MWALIFIVAVIALACSAGIITWITRNKDNVSEESFNRLGRTFMQHKKEMEQRVAELETVLAEKEQEAKKEYQNMNVPDNNGASNLQNKNRARS